MRGRVVTLPPILIPPSPTAVTDDVAGAPSRPFAGRRVHFVGILGTGMSGLAQMLADDGAVVTGTDQKRTDAAEPLLRRGVKMAFVQDGALLEQAKPDLVVRTAAVRDDHPEFRRALDLGLPTMKYAELLGRAMQHRVGVAVAGTHGKSTTTAMTAFALTKLGLDPSWVVGGVVPQLGAGGSHSGRGQTFVAEACEYDRSFHHLRPTVAVLTNLEADHLDCYGTLDALVESFAHFAALVPPDGTIVARGDDANLRRALKNADAKVQTFGTDDACAWSARVVGETDGCPVAEVRHDDLAFRLRAGVAGQHNLLNALAAVAACAAVGADPAQAAATLETFTGVDRRLQELGTVNGATVVDDYGHHPTEVRVTLAAARAKYRPRKLVVLFQPHQYSRTRLLFDDFARAFADADEVLLADVYAVRDGPEERCATGSPQLADAIRATGVRAAHVPGRDAPIDELRKRCDAGTLVVIMGAGDVSELAAELMRRHRDAV